MSQKIYEIIQDRFVNQIQKVIDGEETLLPWQKPWRGSMPVNYYTGKPYRGINTILLEGGEWLTFVQILNLAKKDPNVKLKKGSKSSMVVFFKFNEKEDKETGETKTYPMLKYFNVFSISDVIGLESNLTPRNEDPLVDEAERVIDDYINRDDLSLEYISGSNRAYYQPGKDRVVMPEKSQFVSINHYYSTLFHELGHSTGHVSRLNRFDITDDLQFGSATYSKEELVAEISAQMMLGKLNINNESLVSNSLSYANGWLKAIKEDVRLIISAAAKAQKASDFVFGDQYEGDDKNE